MGIVEGEKNILEHEVWIFTKVKKRVGCMKRNECPIGCGGERERERES